MEKDLNTAHFHLPGLFEFFELYKKFVPLFFEHNEFFYGWCKIDSIYGSPADCVWGGGRVGFGKNHIEKEILSFSKDYGFSVRLTFSNSLLEQKHLDDRNCNRLCQIFNDKKNGIIVHSDLLKDYIKKNYPDFYFVSSTTKVLTDFSDLKKELNKNDFKFVVPDFRFNNCFDLLNQLSEIEKNKMEFLCNEACWIKCPTRNSCYENVSKKSLGLDVDDWICSSPEKVSYTFTRAMKNPSFIGLKEIQKNYLPNGFSNFKIEGRSLGSALVLEMLLYYLVKPEYQIPVREKIYLDSSLDLF